eukprot:2341464-Rhodomonas_salina.1
MDGGALKADTAPAFQTLTVAASSAVLGAVTTITVSLQPNSPVSYPAVILLSGLTASRTPSSPALPVRVLGPGPGPDRVFKLANASG